MSVLHIRQGLPFFKVFPVNYSVITISLDESYLFEASFNEPIINKTEVKFK